MKKYTIVVIGHFTHTLEADRVDVEGKCLIFYNLIDRAFWEIVAVFPARLCAITKIENV